MEHSRSLIRKTRLRLGLTIEQASELADIEPHQWKNFELAGKHVPKFFGRVCLVLQLDPIPLLVEDGIILEGQTADHDGSLESSTA